MNGFVRDYGKVAGFAAAGAFLLSLVVGLVSGNPFGAALARALLFAPLFACLAAAGRFIVTKYLPDLAGAQASPGSNVSGTAVDITLPEESPVAAARASAYRRSQAGMTADTEQPDSAAPEVEQADESEVLDLDAAPSSPGAAAERDLDDLLPPLPESGTRAGRQQEEGDEESVEEAESVDTPGDADQETVETDSAPSDLGTLPDISTLGAGTHGPGGPRGERLRGDRSSLSPRSSRAAEPPSSPGDEMKGALGSQDPSTLARAIRTVLKRDEKG